MHLKILSQEQTNLLPLINDFSRNYYLVGGTAIVLHIGHRSSIDFDLFTSANSLNIKAIKDKIYKNGYGRYERLFEDTQQKHIIVSGVKVTFFCFPFSVPAETKFFKSIKIPSLLTLGAMKISGVRHLLPHGLPKCNTPEHYQRIKALAHIKPLPKPAMATRSPSLIRPCSQASQSAIGIEAAVVLPNRSMLETTFSSGRFISFCTATVMRALAWCGINKSMSLSFKLHSVNASRITSGKYLSALMNTNFPFMYGNSSPFSIISAVNLSFLRLPGCSK